MKEEKSIGCFLPALFLFVISSIFFSLIADIEDPSILSLALGIFTALVITFFIGIPCYHSGYRRYKKTMDEKKLKSSIKYTKVQIPLIIFSIILPFGFVMTGILSNCLGTTIAARQVNDSEYPPKYTKIIILQIVELIIMTSIYAFVFLIIFAI